MSMPGFTAENALGPARGRYHANARYQAEGHFVHPALSCKQPCMVDCLDHCIAPNDCFDVPATDRAACLQYADACVSNCKRHCCD